jgi:hypothetical protein
MNLFLRDRCIWNANGPLQKEFNIEPRTQILFCLLEYLQLFPRSSHPLQQYLIQQRKRLKRSCEWEQKRMFKNWEKERHVRNRRKKIKENYNHPIWEKTNFDKLNQKLLFCQKKKKRSLARKSETNGQWMTVNVHTIFKTRNSLIW